MNRETACSSSIYSQHRFLRKQNEREREKEKICQVEIVSLAKAEVLIRGSTTQL